MFCKSYRTTNEKLDEVRDGIRELISWAQADSEHASENDAPDTAKDDRAREVLLTRALKLLDQCER